MVTSKYRCSASRGARSLNDHSKPVCGSKIAIVGVSYKVGVGALRGGALDEMHCLTVDPLHDGLLASLRDSVTALPDGSTLSSLGVGQDWIASLAWATRPCCRSAELMSAAFSAGPYQPDLDGRKAASQLP